jgi:FMN phosphatase YigB (HAD superfamily)
VGPDQNSIKKNSLDSKKIQFIIFDMDDTLFDTYGQLVKPASLESCRAMIDAGLNAEIDQCLKARHDLGLSKPRADIYKELVKHFGIRNAGSDGKI